MMSLIIYNNKVWSVLFFRALQIVLIFGLNFRKMKDFAKNRKKSPNYFCIKQIFHTLAEQW